MEHLEIERKFLILLPREEWLMNRPACTKRRIVQTYLTAPEGWERRVRKSTHSDATCYTYTEKTAEAGLCRTEREREITLPEYEQLLSERDLQAPDLIKDRYTFTHEGHIMELDRYPFWQDKAMLEVELQSPDEPFTLPSEIVVLRDVTDDPDLKNHALAMAAKAQGTPEKECPCKRHRCARWGQCEKCRAHHQEKASAVACERLPKEPRRSRTRSR